jgi:hypothetical protein
VKSLLLPIIAMGLLSLTQAQGQIFNVQMTSGFDALNGTAWTSSVAPLAYTGTTWSQSYGGNLSNIPDSNDDPGSTVSYTLSSPNLGVSDHGAATSLPIFGATAFGYQADLTLTLSGLDDSKSYDLVLVSAYDGAYGGTFTIGSLPSQTSVGNSGLGSFAVGQNYVEFTNLTPTSGQIVVTDAPVGDFAMLNGFQLEVAPEPSTYALIGLGLVALAVVASRRKLTA